MVWEIVRKEEVVMGMAWMMTLMPWVVVEDETEMEVVAWQRSTWQF